MSSVAVEDYLKAIYKLATPVESVVSTSALADYLGLKQASVTVMLQKLHQRALLDYQKYQGAKLTPAGEQLAIELIRRHRILEVFLVEKLGFGWDEVDEEAEVLEHAVSAQFIERLYRFLGEPEQDPHGSLIPSVTGEWQQHHWLPLDQLPQCQWAKIERVKGFSPEQLRYLDTLGLRPGVCLQLLEAAPFNGPLCLELDGQKVYVDSHMARQIYLSLTLELTT